MKRFKKLAEKLQKERAKRYPEPKEKEAKEPKK